MENTQKIVADQFWEAHFKDHVHKPLDEFSARKIDFWNTLEQTLTDVDIETVRAVMLSIPSIKISSVEMYERIVLITKHIWDKKRDESS